MTCSSLQENIPSGWPHIEYLVLDAYFGSGTDSGIGSTNPRQYVAASIGLVATFSRGNVTINSTNTATNPVVSPNWPSDPRDRIMAITAFKRGRELFKTRAVQSIVKIEAFPGQNVSTDSQIWDVIQSSANSVFNAVGTNQMGKDLTVWLLWTITVM